MKKLLLLTSVAALTVFAVGCKKDKVEDTNSGGGQTGLVVENQQRSLLVYSTATWCGPCGAYGGPNFKNALTTPNLVALNFQSSGSSDLVPYYRKQGVDTLFIAPFVNQLYNSMRPNGYIPLFTMNSAVLGNSAVTTAQIADAANIYNANSPEAGIAAQATLSGEKFTIDTKMKWFKAGSGEYYITAFIVEKDLNHRQAVGGAYQAVYGHKHIVRATTAGDCDRSTQTVFGEIANGSLAVNAEFTKTLSFTWKNETPTGNLNNWSLGSASNYGVAVVIFKKNGLLYDAVNSVWADVK